MNEIKKLETRATVLMRNLELNSKKIQQAKIKNHNWDTQRLLATKRIVCELVELCIQINELWEYPDSEPLVNRAPDS